MRLRDKFRALPALTGLCLLAATQAPHVQAQQDTVEEVVVWGRSLELIGSANAASQGVVGYEDFSTRPLSRVGELVEVVPGMIATQHSGPGKANQYFLRGFNLDHGSDFSTHFDGMPVNWRTHAHAQGYMDLNFIIPEVVERIDFQKGPYFADTGDFSLAGSNSMKTYDALDEGFAELTLGSEEELRLVAADSFTSQRGTWLYALEHHRNSGHFDLETNLRKYNGLLKYSGRLGNMDSRMTLSAYDSEWSSTNQVPLRAVQQGRIGRFGFIDPDLGGESSRYSLTGGLARDNWELDLYGSRYAMRLINNPTYFLNDPVNGDEFEQEDERGLLGGRFQVAQQSELFGRQADHRLGVEARYDDVRELNLFNTVARRRVGVIREDEAQELSLAVFGETQLMLSSRLRATLGLRVDHFDFDVQARRALNSGSDRDSLWQPKLGLAWRWSEQLEFYGNWGRGFHSNDARAALNRVDPVTGEPTEQQAILAAGEGGELGLRYENEAGFNLSVALFELETDSELVFVGDAGTTEPSDPTERRGIEVNAFWELEEGLVMDLTAAKTEGEFSNLPEGENAIPDAHDEVLGAGLTYTGFDNGWTASLRLRHFGDAALSEDETVVKESSTLVNLGLAYATPRWELGVDVLNLFDREDDDIAYFFESRLAGEAAAVEDIHFHPSLPRTFRAILRLKF